MLWEEVIRVTDVPGQAGESTSVQMLKDVLATLQREATAGSSRELSIAITKTEEALMWREKVPPPQESEAAA